MGDVTILETVTRLDIPVDRVIDGATKADLDSVIIIGYDQDGEEYFASSYGGGESVLWLLRRMELKLLAGPDVEEL